MSCELVDNIGTGDCEQGTTYKSDQNIATVIASELVTEILEDALDIVEDIEEKTTLRVLENLSNKFQTTEMSVTEKTEGACSLPLSGLGDQLEPDEGIGEESSVKHRPVEKKSRLTDLVKNSKQMLAKLILNETGKDTGREKVLRVVELDSGDQPYKLPKKLAPELVPLPRADSKEILEEPMEEIRLCCSHDKGTQKGEDDMKTKKTMTFPMASTSGKHLSLAARYRTMKFPPELKANKWNIGTKIVNYIRKHQSKKDKGKQASNGVELKPREDDI